MQETLNELDGFNQSVMPEDWSTPPQLSDLKKDQTDATQSHDRQKAKIGHWLDNLNVEGSAKISTPKNSSNVQPKLIRKLAEWRYPALSEPFLASGDLFTLKPVTWEDTKAAQQNALVLNNQFRTKLNKVDFIDSFVRAAVDEGTVIVRLGWEFEAETRTRTVPDVTFLPDPRIAPLLDEIANLKATNPTEFKYQVPQELKEALKYSLEAGLPHRPIIRGQKEEEYEKVLRNAPTVEVCDYRNVMIDPSCKGDFDKAQFVIYSFETSLSELKREGTKYSNLERINFESNSPLGAEDHDSLDNQDFNFSDDARKRIVAHEYWGYWDYDGSGIAKPFVATWVGNTLIRMEESPFPDNKLPFVVVPFLKKKNSVYGEPDGELLIENQKIIGAVTRGMIDIMGKSANGQTGVRKDAMDVTNFRKFQQGKDYQYNPGVDPRMAFYMHTYPEIPQSAQFMLDLQNNDAEAMTGVKAFSSGISSSGLGEVATGIRGALDAASKRETGILRRLAQGMKEVGRKIIAMNQEFLEDEEIIRITNEDFVAIRRDELAGDFDMEVDVSSIEEDNLKAQELAFMLQTMGPNIDPAIALKILAKIARLRKMPDLAHEFENYQPQVDPMQQQMQQLEMMEKIAKIAQIEAETGNKEAQSFLTEVKAITEQARSRLLGSQADNEDLKFVETESGVTQERAKELHGEQARANMELEVLKAQLNKSEPKNTELDKYKSRAA